VLFKIKSVTDTLTERVAHSVQSIPARQSPTPLGPGRNDLGHARVGRSFVARTWAVMALARRHTFQVLTKRPKRLAVMLADPGFVRQVGRRTRRSSAAPRMGCGAWI